MWSSFLKRLKKKHLLKERGKVKESGLQEPLPLQLLLNAQQFILTFWKKNGRHGSRKKAACARTHAHAQSGKHLLTGSHYNLHPPPKSATPGQRNSRGPSSSSAGHSDEKSASLERMAPPLLPHFYWTSSTLFWTLKILFGILPCRVVIILMLCFSCQV